MGSPQLAVPSLRAVAKVGQVVGVVTQPPRGRGRGLRIAPSPVAQACEEMGLSPMTPASIRTPEFAARIREMGPDVAVVVAYGKILPPELLAIPALGCVNVHASLLPELRGAAPIQWAIARGHRETGVTLMLMDEGMDTGPILLQRSTAIGARETSLELGERLSRMGADLLEEALPALERGELRPVPQDAARATYAPLLTKEDGKMDWSLDASALADRVRGFSPWPGTYTTARGGRLLITGARATTRKHGIAPGQVLSAGPEGIEVACGQGTLLVTALKPEGRRTMEPAEFLAGHRVAEGDLWGD
ncbi:MAG: methionyl-tRNA formyltransferase [bacterium]|nr:MAG: methionyl-tRNA formyltransferase [bacterium]